MLTHIAAQTVGIPIIAIQATTLMMAKNEAINHLRERWKRVMPAIHFEDHGQGREKARAPLVLRKPIAQTIIARDAAQIPSQIFTKAK